MATTVTASEAEKNFATWHDRAMSEPVRITKDGKETAYLISAKTFHELWSSFRGAVRVEDLTELELDMIRASEIAPDHVYEIESEAGTTERRG